jgi:cell division protease FtsH
MSITKPNGPKPGNNNIFAFIAIVLAISALAVMWNGSDSISKKITLNQFLEEVQAGKVAKITLDTESDRLNVTRIDNTQVYTYKEAAATLDDLLKNIPEDVKKDIETDIQPISSNGFWLTLLINVLPMLLIVGFFLFMMRQAQSSNNQAMSFGKSKAKVAGKFISW